DAGGRRKPFLAACILIAVPASALLALARPGMGAPGMASGVMVIAACLALANIAYELSSIFYNALLAQVSTPERFGSASG
ncbi:hypothetical protein ACE4ZV_26985, partial [Salmonella enterica]|uniref:hypothetical protein n=1 Tax=Salmonella enterica TaxID=28901 RepID=UPI003D282F28